MTTGDWWWDITKKTVEADTNNTHTNTRVMAVDEQIDEGVPVPNNIRARSLLFKGVTFGMVLFIDTLKNLVTFTISPRLGLIWLLGNG